ncbi:glycosyltransferase [Oxynema sp. CENA135]|uniref:glycosyltransferase n=1 Tax=Oxynema sp. CENA135 TaxID=984206 RepID=UPI00190AC440|nr:glycosyltransferase [Oxynema sp. CENA135]MBK4728699.1 glycosyltransferase [Oxynema sp. CENA135]
MKTLHLLGAGAYLPWSIGGSIVSCHRLCQNLQALGTEVKVAIHQHPSGREPLGNHIYEGVPLRILPPIPDLNQRIALYKRETEDAVGFQQFLAEYQPDVVHFHDFTVSAGITHMRLAKEVGCNVVMTYHTPGNSCSQHGLLYQGKKVCNGQILLHRCSECRLSDAGMHPTLANLAALWSPTWLEAENSGKLNRLLTTRRMTEIFRDAWLGMVELVDALHVHTEWVEQLVKLNGVPPSKVYFFRTGGPKAIQASTKRLQTDDCLQVVFAGRCSAIKGIHVVVEAIERLPSDLPVKVTFFSPNWEEGNYGRSLQQRISGNERFELKHDVPNSQFLEQLADYDLWVVPSLWLETGPLTVLEAFAAGIPIIGSRLGGIAELIRDGIDGLLFEPGNSQELAAILERFVCDREQLKRLKANVKAHRTMADVARDSLNLYRRLKNLNEAKNCISYFNK